MTIIDKHKEGNEDFKGKSRQTVGEKAKIYDDINKIQGWIHGRTEKLEEESGGLRISGSS